MSQRGPTRREFLEGAAAAAAAGVMLQACDGGGEAGNHPPSNASPIPESQLTTMPEDPYDDRRVVRAYDRRVTDYEFGDSEVSALHVDPDVAQQMLEAAIVVLARQESVEAAWEALLPGDLSAARVAVKINLNGDEPRFINTSAGMVVAMARSLASVGVAHENMTFFDRSRRFHGTYREAIEAEVDGLVLQGAGDVPAHETETFTAATMILEDGSAVTVPTPRCVVEADHLINLHVLKGQAGGVTGSMKNLFGFARNVWSSFHGQRALGLNEYHRGLQCGDLATQPIVRTKSRLLISEGVYGSWWNANRAPDRYRNEDLFPDGLPCTLVAGRNPLHHDMVLFDLVAAERDYAPLDEGYDHYPDDWLQACAREPYEIGVFEHGRLVDGTFTARDLEYSYLDYRSLTTDV